MKKYIEGFKQFVAEANDDYIEGIIQSVANRKCPYDFGLHGSNHCQMGGAEFVAMQCEKCWIDALGGNHDV